MDPSEGVSEELPLHTVYVSAVYMDANLVSYSQWQTVCNWAIAHGYTFDYPGSGKASTHPVQTIDWYDAVKWCNARSEMEGRVPAYYTDPGLSVRYRAGEVAPYVNWCGVSPADGGGVGEGRAGRGERAAVSVGQHDLVEPGQLLRVPIRLPQLPQLPLRCEFNERL